MCTGSLNRYSLDREERTTASARKWLRLNEARRLMLNEGFDAANAAFEVGYKSPSQFSREYARLFGASPKRDVVSIRTKIAPTQRSLRVTP